MVDAWMVDAWMVEAARMHRWVCGTKKSRLFQQFVVGTALAWLTCMLMMITQHS